MLNIEKILATATPRPWYRLEVIGKSFVAAKPTEDHPYFQKTRHMDVMGDEYYPRRESDIALCNLSVNAYEANQQTIRELKAALEEVSKCDPQSDTCGPDAPTDCLYGCMGCIARAALAKLPNVGQPDEFPMGNDNPVAAIEEE